MGMGEVFLKSKICPRSPKTCDQKEKIPLATAPRFSQPIFESKDKIMLNNFSKIKG